MALHGKEKIWFLVSRLLDEREITAEGEPIGLHPANDLNGHYSLSDLGRLSQKLEGESVAKLISLPTDQTHHRVLFELLSKFDEYVAELEDDQEYLEWCGKKPKPKKGPILPVLAPEDLVDFSKTSKENEGKQLVFAQIMDLNKMPEEERNRVISESLTLEQRKSMEEIEEVSKKFANQFKGTLSPSIPSFALPQDYGAEQVGLLRQLVKQRDSTAQHSTAESVHWITYTASRQILLDDDFLLTTTRLNSENDVVFSFLYQNPNKPHTKAEIEAAISQPVHKKLHKVVENLGFTGDIARVFFSVSKGSIEFRNPITSATLSEMGITKIRLNRS